MEKERRKKRSAATEEKYANDKKAHTSIESIRCTQTHSDILDTF